MKSVRVLGLITVSNITKDANMRSQQCCYLVNHNEDFISQFYGAKY